jgi:ABC-2 type transport system permease protein
MIIVSDGDLISNDVSSSGTIFPLGYDKNIKYTYTGNKHLLINAVQYLCDDVSLSHLKRKELSLRMLDREKVQNNKPLLQLVNIISPIVILLIFAFYFIQNRKRKYA